jgi:hypothetical protein
MAKSNFSSASVKLDRPPCFTLKLNKLNLKNYIFALLVSVASQKPEHKSPFGPKQDTPTSNCFYYIKIKRQTHSSNILCETFDCFFNQGNIANKVNAQTATLDGWA